MNQFNSMVRSLLKFLVAYAMSLIELFGQLFWFYKKREEQHDHENFIVVKEGAEIVGKTKRKDSLFLLMQKLKRMKSIFFKVAQFEMNAFEMLENESNQMIMEKAVLDFVYVRVGEAIRVNRAKKSFRKFKRMHKQILQKLSPPSSPECLLSMMPLEMWEAVANRIGDAQTWISLYNVNPVLQTVLKRNRTTVLLQEILKLVYQNLSRDVLRLTDLSHCRLVCKNWRRSVDEVVSDQRIRLAFCQEYSSGMMTWSSYKHPTSIAYSFESVERLLLEPYAGIRPFPSGHLVVNEVNELTTDTTRFRLAVTRMLRKFGRDVKYFSFSNDAHYNPICWYFFLKRWLSLMPNLMRLDLEFCMDAGQVISREYFNVFEFPRLENLVVLQLENVPGSVISCALRRNPQIQKLRVIRENKIHFPLWEIPANMNSLSHFFILAYSYRDIMQLEKIDSCLEAIQIETSGSTGIYNSSRVFEALKRFQTTLKYLKLELRSPPDTGLYLHLCQLNELNLIFHADINVDFILPLKSLKRFSVKILNRRFRPGSKFEMIKFNSCIENMKESNVWDLFPHLEIVTIYTYNCRFQFKGKHTFVCRRAQMGV